MPVVLLLAVAAIIVAGVIAVAIGRGGELAPAPADFAPLDLTEVTSTDVALLRPPSALWGYHREATDEALGQIARTISDQEVQIATLQRQLAELLPRRIPPGTGPAGLGPAATGPVGSSSMGTGPMGVSSMGASPMGTSPGGPPFPDLEPPRGLSFPPGMDPPPWMGTASRAEPADPPPGMEPQAPSRPSILHRELADQAGDPDPAPAADPWSAWQRRAADEATPRTSPGAGPGADRGRDAGPGEQAAGPPQAAGPGEDS